MSTNWKYTAELLEPLVAQSQSVAGVLRLLGLRQDGGTHSHISRTIKKLNIDTTHFRAVTPRHSPTRRTAEEILVRRPGTARREKPAVLRRALTDLGRPYQCAICLNTGEWMGGALTLDIDHIDGDFLNNEASNLRYLCPNCHRQTPHFAGRGKGRFRS